MLGNRRIQQGVFSKKLKRWSILCNEGNVKALYQRKPERKHHIKRKVNLFDVKSPIYCETQPLLWNSQLCLFHLRLYILLYLDCPGGELFYYLKSVKRMSEENARFYFIEILYGLMYLHQQNIIYRDLKPENLLINHDGHVKIADFGLSKYGLDSREVTNSFCGSTEYMPPEMIQKSGHSYGVDFYTLGALLYELVTGLPPFYSRNEE